MFTKNKRTFNCLIPGIPGIPITGIPRIPGKGYQGHKGYQGYQGYQGHQELITKNFSRNISKIEPYFSLNTNLVLRLNFPK